MSRKAFPLVLSLLLVGILLLVSCGPRAAPPPAAEPAPIVPAPAAPTPAVPTPAAPTPGAPTPASAAEKPKYGGTVNVILPTFLEKFDIAVSPG